MPLARSAYTANAALTPFVIAFDVTVEPPIASIELSDDEPVPSVTTLYSEALVPLNCAKNEGSCLALIPRPAVSLIVRIDVPRYVPSVESPTENLISPP